MSLLWNRKPLSLNVELACVLGLNEAIVLQQLQFWLTGSNSYGIEHEGRRWIYNSIESWRDQFPFWSGDTIRRTLKRLEQMGVVQSTKLKAREHNHTKYYTIVPEHPLLAIPEIDTSNLHKSDAGNLQESDHGNLQESDMGNLPKSDVGNLPNSDMAESTNVTKKTNNTNQRQQTKKTPTQTYMGADAPELVDGENFGLKEALKRLPDGLRVQTFKDWHKVRTKKGATMSLTAWERITASFELITQAGYDLDDAVGLATERGWTSIKLEYLVGNIAKRGEVPAPYDDIVAAYHEWAPNLGAVQILDDKLRSLIAERWNEDVRAQRIEFWQRFFAYCAKIARDGWRVKWLGEDVRPNLEIVLTRHVFRSVMARHQDEKRPDAGQGHQQENRASA